MTISTLGYVSYLYLFNNQSVYYYIPQGILNAIALLILIVRGSIFNRLKRDLKNCDYNINREVVSPIITKIYRRLICVPIELNWISAGIYVIIAGGVLLTFIVTYFLNLANSNINDFTRLILWNGDQTPLICVWSFGGVAIATLVYQIFYNIFDMKRRNEMELYYQKEIISEEAQAKLRKGAHVKGGIIFTVITFIVTFAVVVTFLVLKKKALK